MRLDVCHQCITLLGDKANETTVRSELFELFLMFAPSRTIFVSNKNTFMDALQLDQSTLIELMDKIKEKYAIAFDRDNLMVLKTDTFHHVLSTLTDLCLKAKTS